MKTFFAHLKSRQMKLEGLLVEKHTGFWWRNLTERDKLEDLVVEGDNIKMNV